MKINYFFVIIFLISAFECFSYENFSGKSEIITDMFSESIIDSAEWSKLESYFFLPLNVPSGEIEILKKMYPIIIQSDAYQDSILSKYYPWGEKEVIRFFSDFPELIDFQQILDFSYIPLQIKGRLTISTSKLNNCKLSNPGIRLFIKPVYLLSIDGRVLVTENYLRWCQRKVNVSLPGGIGLQIGSIDGIDDDGLLLGKFCQSGLHADSDAVSNWLYGDGHDWNGAALTYNNSNIHKKIIERINIVAHIQKSESIGALDATVRLCKLQLMTLGIAGVKSLSMNPVYAYLKTKINSGHLKCDFLTGTDLRNPSEFPIYLMTKYQINMVGVSCKIYHYPDNEKYPLSNLNSDLEKMINDSISGQSLSRIRFSGNFNDSGHIAISNAVELNYANYRLNVVKGALKIAHTGNRISCIVDLIECFYTDGRENIHCYGLLTTNVNYNCSFTIAISTDTDSSRFDFDKVKFSANLMFFEVMACKPFVELVSITDKFGINAGININLKLLYGTATQIRFNCPVKKNNLWKECNIECKGTFAF